MGEMVLDDTGVSPMGSTPNKFPHLRITPKRNINKTMKQKIEGGGLATGAENYLKNRYNEDLKIVLEFVERWNKQDKEIEVAVAASNLKFLDLMDYKKKP